jgi:hypothetical protein
MLADHPCGHLGREAGGGGGVWCFEVMGRKAPLKLSPALVVSITCSTFSAGTKLSLPPKLRVAPSAPFLTTMSWTPSAR